MTVRELIRKALLLIGAIAHSENVSAEEASDALNTLNDILESWSNQGLLIYAKTIETFSLVAAQASYTIGSGGNFNTTNPQIIEQASIVDNSVEYPLHIISSQEFAEITNKTVSAQIPNTLFFNRGATTSTIYLNPVPSTTNQIKLYSLKPLTAYSSLNTTVTLPSGYRDALKYALAVKLSPEYGKPVSADIEKQAINSKRELKRLNTDPLFLESDLFAFTDSSRKTYDIYKGE